MKNARGKILFRSDTCAEKSYLHQSMEGLGKVIKAYSFSVRCLLSITFRAYFHRFSSICCDGYYVSVQSFVFPFRYIYDFHYLNLGDKSVTFFVRLFLFFCCCFFVSFLLLLFISLNVHETFLLTLSEISRESTRTSISSVLCMYRHSL